MSSDITQNIRFALAGPVSLGAAHVPPDGGQPDGGRGVRANTTPRPPLSNRGVTDGSAHTGLGSAETLDAIGGPLVSTTWAGVHWFSGTSRAPIAQVLEAVSGMLAGAPVVQHERGARGGYSHSASCSKAFVAWGNNRPDVLVTLPGEICEQLGIAGLVALAVAAGLEPSSRLDVAWDVDGITPALLRAEWEAGNIVSRLHRDSWQWIESPTGTTFYMGSRTSERFVRAYDKRGPCRIELELKERRAVALWRRLVALHDEAAWSIEALAELRALVDYRDRSQTTVVADCSLLDWWAEFVQGAERRSTVFPRLAATLERFDKWLRRQVAPVLALVRDAYGDDVMRDLLTLGRARYRSRPDRMALIQAEWLRQGVIENAAD